MTLLARSVDEYLHRLLVEEDAAAGPGPRVLAEAAGPDGGSVYKTGDLAAAGLGEKLHLYIIKKIGMFPDVTEALSHSHLKKGDEVSGWAGRQRADQGIRDAALTLWPPRPPLPRPRRWSPASGTCATGTSPGGPARTSLLLSCSPG